MSRHYIKPTKKFVSRGYAIRKLRVTDRQFDEMCVLNTVFPVLAPERQTLDRGEYWYYYKTDVKKLYYSDSYAVIRKNSMNEVRRSRYREHNETEKLENCVDDSYALVELVKTRYETFGDSLSGLGGSLHSLYLLDRIGRCSPAHRETLDNFEAYVLSRGLLDCAFLSKRGIYFGVNCEHVRVVWSVPYGGEDLSDTVEARKTLPKKLETRSIDLPDFPASESAEEEPPAPISGFVPAEMPADVRASRMDCALLEYAAPLNAMHVKLVLHKLGLLYPQAERPRAGLFAGRRVHVAVPSIGHWLEFILKNEEAELVEESAAEVVVTECVEALREGVSYVQPQYLLDSLNAKQVLDPTRYGVGKELPPHASPFPDVMSALDARAMKTLSNKRRYRIFDLVKECY